MSGLAEKSAVERATEKMRFVLAVAGRKALTLARDLGYSNWDECELMLRRTLAQGKQDAKPGATPLAESGSTTTNTSAEDQASRIDTSAFRIEKPAQERIEAEGIDIALLAAFLKGKGSGRFGNVTLGDVERYLNSNG